MISCKNDLVALYLDSHVAHPTRWHATNLRMWIAARQSSAELLVTRPDRKDVCTSCWNICTVADTEIKGDTERANIDTVTSEPQAVWLQLIEDNTPAGYAARISC